VSSIRKLYARFRQLIHEGFKFLVIGAVGFIVTIGVANALHPIGKYKAITIATILATAITYLGNRYWTFRHRQGKGTTRDSTMFFVLNGVGLLIYYGCIGLIDLAGLGHSVAWYNVALVVGTGLGTLFRFWSYRRWIWLDTGHGGGTAAPEARAERDEEQAEHLAAAIGGVPVGHPSAARWDAFTRSQASGSPASNGASAASNGSSAASNGASADGDSGDHADANGARSAPPGHARPGRPSFRPSGDRQREPGSTTPASHRRTS
jgi:putative flippase GtrA